MNFHVNLIKFWTLEKSSNSTETQVYWGFWYKSKKFWSKSRLGKKDSLTVPKVIPGIAEFDANLNSLNLLNF